MYCRSEPIRPLTSIVSYPERGDGGDNRYRGNCSPKLIEDLIISLQGGVCYGSELRKYTDAGKMKQVRKGLTDDILRSLCRSTNFPCLFFLTTTQSCNLSQKVIRKSLLFA